MCFPSEVDLTAPLVPLAQLLRKYNYSIKFFERFSTRFLDVHCVHGSEDYLEDWGDAETSYYETTSDFQSEEEKERIWKNRMLHIESKQHAKLLPTPLEISPVSSSVISLICLDNILDYRVHTITSSFTLKMIYFIVLENERVSRKTMSVPKLYSVQYMQSKGKHFNMVCCYIQLSTSPYNRWVIFTDFCFQW